MSGTLVASFTRRDGWFSSINTSNLLATEHVNSLMNHDIDDAITIDHQKLVITAHKKPQLFKNFDTNKITQLFENLASETKVALATLVYKHKEYHYLANKFDFVKNLTPEEKQQVCLSICKGILISQWSMPNIQYILNPAPNDLTLPKTKENYKERCESFFDAIANSPPLSFDDLVQKIKKYNLTIHKEEDKILIPDLVRFLFEAEPHPKKINLETSEAISKLQSLPDLTFKQSIISLNHLISQSALNEAATQIAQYY